MKRTSVIFLAVALTALAGVAVAQDVYSVNTVGFYKVDILPAGKMYLAAMQFDQINPADETMLGVFGTNNLRKSNLPTAADRLYLWDGVAWHQFFQKTDGQFYDVTAPTIPTNPALHAATAFFLQSPGPSTTTNTITLKGQVIEDTTVLTSVPVGLRTYAYPFSERSALKDMALDEQGTAANLPTAADRLYLYNSASNAYQQCWLKLADRDGYDTAVTGGSPQNPTVALGQAFWYQARNAFSWSETNVYLGNL